MDFGVISRLGRESRIRLPNVDEILDLGYAAHAADDAALRGTDAQTNAKQIIARFIAMEPRNDTEAAYLACAQAIVLTHGRALARRKRTWEGALDAARLERERLLDRIRQSRHQNSWLSLVWRLLGPVILGLTGYLVARVLAFVVPDDIAAQTGHNVPSILMGLVFVFIGRSVAFWLSDQQRSAIELHYDARCYQADIAYELGKREEHHYYRARLCEAWKQYTDEDYPKTASYEMVMAGDIETRKRLERQRLVFNRTTLWLLRRAARLLRGKKSKKRNGAIDDEAASPADDLTVR
jgi:hypothetical protein